VIILAAGIAGVVPGAAAQSAAEDAVTFIRAGVTDPISQARKELAQGSGFLIDAIGHIITARHVIYSREREEPGPRWISVSLRDRNANGVPAQVIACEAANIDLCLIKVPDVSVRAASIDHGITPACRLLNVGEGIFSLGYPVGEANPVLRIPGQVTGGVGTELKYPSNVLIQPGMSGGPALDSRGLAVAVNFGAAEGRPTFTFLQPLLYGIGLIVRTGIPCVPQQPPATNVSCAQKQQSVDRTQSDHGASTTVRDYQEVIEANTGCRIKSVRPDVRSANNHTGPSISIATDGKTATISYSLRSGPFFDQYRGWINMVLIAEQEPN
jgi:hypothetical protein